MFLDVLTVTPEVCVLQRVVRTGRTGSGNIMTSEMAEAGAATAARHHKTSSRLLSRLRCGLQTRLLCTAGLSCKPPTHSATDLTVTRRRVDSKLRSTDVQLVSAADRKRIRKSSSDDVITSTDSGVGRSLEALDCASHAASTSGYLTTSGSLALARSTCDVIGRRRLTTVDELEAPPEMTSTWSAGDHATGNDVTGSPMTARRRRKVAGQLRSQLYSNCSQFYGQSFIVRSLCILCQ